MWCIALFLCNLIDDNSVIFTFTSNNEKSVSYCLQHASQIISTFEILRNLGTTMAQLEVNVGVHFEYHWGVPFPILCTWQSSLIIWYHNRLIWMSMCFVSGILLRNICRISLFSSTCFCTCWTNILRSCSISQLVTFSGKKMTSVSTSCCSVFPNFILAIHSSNCEALFSSLTFRQGEQQWVSCGYLRLHLCSYSSHCKRFLCSPYRALFLVYILDSNVHIHDHLSMVSCSSSVLPLGIVFLPYISRNCTGFIFRALCHMFCRFPLSSMCGPLLLCHVVHCSVWYLFSLPIWFSMHPHSAMFDKDFDTPLGNSVLSYTSF